MGGKGSGRWKQMFSNAGELEKILDKGCKGSVTELTKVAERMLIKNTKAQFGPTAPNHLVESREPTVPYKRTGNFVRSISIRKTMNEGDAFSNEVYFDENRMENFSKRKSHNYLGTYMDTKGRFVYGEGGDEDIEGGLISWLEYGTTIDEPHMAKFSRKGAGFMEQTQQEIEKFIDGKMAFIIESYIDVDVAVEKAGIGISRYK